MKKNAQQWTKWLYYFACAWLPWQTVFIIEAGMNQGFVAPFAILKLYASEALIFTFAIAWLITHRKRIQYSNKNTQKIPLIITIVVILLSILRAPSMYIALQAYSWIAVTMCIAYAMYHEKRRIGLVICAVSITLNVMLGISQFINQSVVESTVAGISAQHPETRGVPVIIQQQDRILRAFGSMPHPNIFGGYAVLLLLMSIIISQLNRWEPYAEIIWIIALLGLLLSFSRSAWLSAIFVGAWALFNLHSKKFVRKMVNISALTIALFGLMYHSGIMNRITPTHHIETQSVSQRVQQYTIAKSIFVNHMWLGTGIHNYTQAVAQKFSTTPGYALTPLHNTILLVIIEFGIIGTALIGYLLWSVRTIVFQKQLLVSLLILSPILLFDHYLWTTYPGIILSGLVITMSTLLNTNSSHQN